MKTDIVSGSDIETLVNTFYDKVKKDDAIGFIFNDIIGDDWSAHLPVMYKFWESVLLSQPGYQGNAVRKHIDVDKVIPLHKAHFDRWLALWNDTVDELYEGEIASLAKNKAMLMAHLINMKVDMSRGAGFIQ